MDLLTKLPTDRKIKALLFAIGLVFILPAAQASGIYKWVDNQGNVHYSQDPQGQSAQQMKLKIPKTSSADDDSSAQTASQNAEEPENPSSEDKQKTAEKQAAAQDREEAKKKNCQIAMKRLATISAGGRLYEVDAKGERHYWDDDTRKAKLDEAQKNVDDWCGQE